MGFEVVESSVLKVCKVPIQELAGFAEHYYLAENANLDNSVGWGSSGLELRGLVKITSQELERIERFMSVAKYSIAVNNCEHFANYVLYGINFLLSSILGGNVWVQKSSAFYNQCRE
jgi:hypothetical protein